MIKGDPTNGAPLPAVQTLLNWMATLPPRPKTVEAYRVPAPWSNHRLKPVEIAEVREIPEIKSRFYRPSGDGPRPCLIYYHGGCWVWGSVDAVDPVCRALAGRAGCAVISVDYRLAPENPFPAGLEDCVNAVRWAADHAGDLGIDGGRLAVGGDSAGGNLAAAVAMRLRDGGPALRFQALIYPVTDITRFDTESYLRYAKGHLLEREVMQWGGSLYLKGGADRSNPLVSVLHAEDLSGLPPAWVCTAECDVLRDEGEAYARRLPKADLVRYNGLIHGFIGLAGMIPEADGALSDCAAALAGGLS